METKAQSSEVIYSGPPQARCRPYLTPASPRVTTGPQETGVGRDLVLTHTVGGGGAMSSPPGRTDHPAGCPPAEVLLPSPPRAIP